MKQEIRSELMRLHRPDLIERLYPGGIADSYKGGFRGKESRNTSKKTTFTNKNKFRK